MIDNKLLNEYKDRFEKTKENRVIKGAIARTGIKQASVDNDVFRKHSFVFSKETKRGEITNQKSSGRCWMFAALNTARVDTMEKLNIDNFEFSQNYTLFWDKLEKANYFLNSIIETIDEPQDSRLIAHLLTDPVQDGGQWDMFSGMLEKYGAVPKSAMPETYHSSNTRDLNEVLTTELRGFAVQLREASANESVEELKDKQEDMLYVIYNILVKALGDVPTTFTYEYRDRDGKFCRIKDCTPQEFFKKYVGWNLADRVSLINAPTEDKPYGRSYTVQFLGTIAEAEPIRYINVPMDILKKAAVESIKNGEPVWYGCDVGKQSLRDAGIMDENSYHLDLTLGTTTKLTKAQRLDYGESMLTHAMVLVGVDLDSDGKPINWKVENSWGDKSGKKGVFSMSDKWMDEYAYQISVDKKYIDEKWLKALDESPIELEPWDPMGALATMQ